jgi:cbb3-type cytochrome c oxidase subunit III
MSKVVFAGLATMSLLAMAAVSPSPSALPKAEMDKMVDACATCHGTNGEGLEARSAPRLAGLSKDYISRQLANFASGKRGTDTGDIYGSQMVAISKTLKPDDIDAVAAYYAGLSASAPHPVVPGDVGQGKLLYESCAACHGEDGMGIAELGAPRLAGQADWYVLHSLKLYKSNSRGAGDTYGQQMVAAMQVVPDEKAMRDVTAYLATLSER